MLVGLSGMTVESLEPFERFAAMGSGIGARSPGYDDGTPEVEASPMGLRWPGPEMLG